MLKRIPQRLIILPVAVLVAAIGYLNLDSDSASPDVTTAESQHNIDFYSNNSHTIQFNSEGKIHYQFSADLVEHVQQTDISLLTKPRLKLERGSEQPWYISGLRGEVSPGGEEVDLYEEVRVERIDAKQRPFLLQTTHLTYVFADDFAHTKQAVRIDSAQGVTNATGMRAYLPEERVELLTRVRGKYETQ